MEKNTHPITSSLERVFMRVIIDAAEQDFNASFNNLRKYAAKPDEQKLMFYRLADMHATLNKLQAALRNLVDADQMRNDDLDIATKLNS